MLKLLDWMSLLVGFTSLALMFACLGFCVLQLYSVTAATNLETACLFLLKAVASLALGAMALAFGALLGVGRRIRSVQGNESADFSRGDQS